MNNLVPFSADSALPALPEDLIRAGQEMNAALAGGLEGRMINRISVRNGRWVMMRGGEIVHRLPEDHIDVVIVATADKVSRIFYLKGYDPNAAKERPTCWSHDGAAPARDVPESQRQSNACASCPKNEKGSATDGKSRACAFKKQIVVVPGGGEESQGIDAANPVPWLLTVNAQSMYDESNPAKNEYSLKGYAEFLKRPRNGAPNGVPVGYVLTRMTTDPESTTAKYWFTPLAFLNPTQIAKSVQLFRDPEVRDLLDQTSDELALAQGDRSPGVPEKDRSLPAPAPVQAATPSPAAAPTPAATALRGWGEFALASGADMQIVDTIEMLGGPGTEKGRKLWDTIIGQPLAGIDVNNFGAVPAAAMESKLHWREYGLAEGATEKDLDTIESLGGPGNAKGRVVWDALVGVELTDDIDLSVDEPAQSENPAPAAATDKPKARRGRPPKAKTEEAAVPAAATPNQLEMYPAPPPPPPVATPVAAAPVAGGPNRAADLMAAVNGFDD